MLEPYANECAEKGEVVFGEELLERDKEGWIERSTGRYRRIPASVSWTASATEGNLGDAIPCSTRTCDRVPHQKNGEGDEIGYHGNEEDKLCKVGRTPCSLQVAPAVENCQPGDNQAKEILLHEGRGQKNPWVYYGFARYDGQIRSSSIFYPVVRIGWIDGCVEDGEDKEGYQEEAGERWYV